MGTTPKDLVKQYESFIALELWSDVIAKFVYYLISELDNYLDSNVYIYSVKIKNLNLINLGKLTYD
jgi:hypothetical protein